MLSSPGLPTKQAGPRVAQGSRAGRGCRPGAPSPARPGVPRLLCSRLFLKTKLPRLRSAKLIWLGGGLAVTQCQGPENKLADPLAGLVSQLLSSPPACPASGSPYFPEQRAPGPNS